jgi:hypothetical protein
LAQTHETITSFRKVEASSDRKFGLTVGALLAAASLLPLLHHRAPHLWLLIVAAVLVLLGAVFPAALTGLNRAWFKLGLALNTIVSPIVMGLLFYGAVVPVGWFLRKQGEDILALKSAPEAATYWITRTPPSPSSGSLSKQF